ncbi:30S ribosomal protein S13 [Candidatus Beckwithbacteria bacterium CG2_30_44_31]|uniref:Small ribosomal subunit protein uS13 n=1 Tax=Candidatus Beckwithbacteria bacterium CG2_30_44_31 TaxID=1805035 RepID=A0A1J5AYN4_9BACT|nr:MAG: 30S ribosomal protein S13 [Candidatus Beckwithbacteria bacterium CG2_30_44_31]
MVRISGVDIPAAKRTEIALTYIFGVGRRNVGQLLKLANVNPDKRAKDLTSDEIGRLQKATDTISIEGPLRGSILDNIKRLKQIGTYRGLRHSNNLPSRGQHTRHNARTKRGKRMTVGALKKEDAAKIETAKKEKE